MELIFLRNIKLTQAKIYQIHSVLIIFISTNQEISRLYISVNNMPGVDKINAFKHLNTQHQHCFQRKYIVNFE